MPAGTLPPPTAPVAAPFNLEIDVAPAQVARSTSPKLPELPKPALLIDLPSPQLFNQDETWVGTLPAPAKKTGLAKLAIPTIALATVGGVVAAIVMFGGKDTRPAKPSPSLAQPAAPSAPAAPAEETILRPSPRAIESANAATASAGGEQPEPPTKAEQAAEIASASLTHDVPSDQREPIAGANAALAESARPATREVRTPNGVVTYADIRIDSDPAGATVTLVDRGKQSFLGSTPLSTSIDTSREYDLIVALDGRPTQMVHVDPSKTSRVDVSLGRTVPRGGVALAVTAESVEETKAPAAKAKVVDDTALESTKADAVVSPKAAKVAKVEVPKAEAKATKTETKAEPKAVKTDKAETTETKPAPKAAKTDKAETAETKAAPVATSGTGTLMVSSKPPCEILIDGKATGLTTPQRAIELPAGAHKITFVNEAAGIKKTVSVKITPDQSTKLIQDLMK